MLEQAHATGRPMHPRDLQVKKEEAESNAGLKLAFRVGRMPEKP